MKLATLALALGLASPAFAAVPLSVDFEKNWSFDEVANTYAAQGVSFTNVLGLSNGDGLGSLANGDYYAGAPSSQGVAFVQLDGVTTTTAYMNVDTGVHGALSFFHAGTDTFTINAYSGLNGSGSLVGTVTVGATGGYDSWKHGLLSITGAAKSFDLSSSNGVAAFDNISAVPEPSSIALLLAGGALIAARRRRG